MKKLRKLSQPELEKLKLKYVRPTSPFQDFSGSEYIRRIASSVGSAFDVKVSLSDRPSQVNMTTQEVNLNESQAYENGDDFSVGIILHEVGHLKHTPRGSSFRDGWHHELHNLFEDVRMEHLVKQEYAGAPYFIDAINSMALGKITEAAMKPVVIKDKWNRSDHIKKTFYTILQHAIARAYGADTSASFSLEDIAMSIAADTISDLMLQSETATADKCLDLSNYARDVMEQFINPPKPEPQQSKTGGSPQPTGTGKPEKQEGGKGAPQGDGKKDAQDSKDGTPKPGDNPAESQKSKDAPVEKPKKFDISPSADKVELLERIEETIVSYRYVGDKDPYRYERADAQAQMYAANLKRSIIAKLRANDRSKVVTRQRRGKLDKKAIVKSSVSDRIYQKRLQAKKRRYVASVILDTSSSMWTDKSGHSRIDLAMQASAMLVRTLRALGVPTALSIYGTKSSERVGHAERYLVPEISRKISKMSQLYFHARHTETDVAIAEQLPKLQRAAHGREQLLIIITDGEVNYSTAKESERLIRSAQKKSVLHPMVFYVETKGRGIHLLNNSKEERRIANASELPKAAAELMASIEFNG